MRSAFRDDIGSQPGADKSWLARRRGSSLWYRGTYRNAIPVVVMFDVGNNTAGRDRVRNAKSVTSTVLYISLLVAWRICHKRIKTHL